MEIGLQFGCGVAGYRRMARGVLELYFLGNAPWDGNRDREIILSAAAATEEKRNSGIVSGFYPVGGAFRLGLLPGGGISDWRYICESHVGAGRKPVDGFHLPLLFTGVWDDFGGGNFVFHIPAAVVQKENPSPKSGGAVGPGC